MCFKSFNVQIGSFILEISIWNISVFKQFWNLLLTFCCSIFFRTFSTFQLCFLPFLAQQLVICVRLALKEGATGAWINHFSGYLITLLVIFYMQVTNRLPPVVNLQSEPGISTEKCGGMFLLYLSLFFEKQSFSDGYYFVVIFLVCFFLRFFAQVFSNTNSVSLWATPEKVLNNKIFNKFSPIN